MTILDYSPCAVCFRRIPPERQTLPIDRGTGCRPSYVCSPKCFREYVSGAQAAAQETRNEERDRG